MKHAITALAGLAALTLSAPAMADDHAMDDSLASVLASDTRGDDGARDKYRNPAETLAFFGVKPDMTVVEYGPGGGWYTRVLAPYLAPKGKYMALNSDSDAASYSTRAREARAKGWTERFKSSVAEMLGGKADDVTAFETDEMPEELEGTADRVLIFRSMHGLNNRNTADTVLKAARKLLKADGMVGVVQHRAPEGASWDDYVGRQRGYLPQETVIALFKANGFELAGSSEINANPKDTADYEGGVWTLPPMLSFGRQSEEEQAKHRAIGESDRMTLLFKKAD